MAASYSVENIIMKVIRFSGNKVLPVMSGSGENIEEQPLPDLGSETLTGADRDK